ncbi:MAG: hypothetical protein LBN10_05160 [Propionibacteriaceae bacterium]|nr:hypothetical protein [Propionibacteriaceae bacterium]
MPKKRTKEEHRDYMRWWRAKNKADLEQAAGLYVLPSAPTLMAAYEDRIAQLEADIPKTVRSAVLTDLDRLEALTKWPAEAAIALRTADILDSPSQKPQHVNASKALFAQLETLRSRAKAESAPDEEGGLDIDVSTGTFVPRPTLSLVEAC